MTKAIGYKVFHSLDFNDMSEKSGLTVDELKDVNGWSWKTPFSYTIIEINDSEIVIYFDHPKTMGELIDLCNGKITGDHFEMIYE